MTQSLLRQSVLPCRWLCFANSFLLLLVVTAPTFAQSSCASATDLLKTINLITIEDLTQVQEVDYNTFVGGNLVNINQSGNQMSAPTFPSYATRSMEVAGTVQSGNFINFFYSGAFGSSNTIVQNVNQFWINGRGFNVNNYNQGSTLVNDNTLSTKKTSIKTNLESASLSLAAASANNTLVIENGNQANFKVNTKDANGIAVFNITDAQLFENTSVAQIEIFNNVNAPTILINVSGTNINWQYGNMVGTWLGSINGRSKTLWNFYEATTINFQSRNMMGAVPAPKASLQTTANIDGATAVKTLNSSAEIHLPYFAGDFSSLCTPICDEPAPFSQCTAPNSGYNRDITVNGDQTWESVLAGISPDNVTQKIRIRKATDASTAIVRVNDKDLKIMATGLLVVEGVQLLVDNGGLILDASGATVIISNGAALRTTKDIQQKSGTYLCITDSEVEVGDEQAGGFFNVKAGGSTTIANFQNEGNRYMKNVCMNVTQDYQNNGGGVDILVNVCAEIGDRGSTHASANLNEGMSRDGNDTGNFQNDGTMTMYNTRFTLPNGNVQNQSNRTTTVCNADFRVDNGGFQNSGTMRGESICVWSANTNTPKGEIRNNSGGTWTATFEKRRGQTYGSFGVTVPANSAVADIQLCFPACSCPGVLQADLGDFPSPWLQAKAFRISPDANADGVPDGNNGAVWAGAKTDTETSLTLSACDTADDLDNLDDEDGLTLPASLIRGQSAQFSVILNSNKNNTLVYYGLWFDWNNDGTFETDATGFYTGFATIITAGSPVNALVNIAPPLTAVDDYKVRLVVSDMAITSGMFANTFSNGEVEDYCKPVALPIELIDFNVFLNKENKTILKWRTASEKNNAYFSIQRSFDGQKWQEIAIQKGAGNSNTIRAYEHIDSNPLPGINYYRIQQFDFDGASSFGPLKLVIVQDKTIATLIYPNPATTFLNIQLLGDVGNTNYQFEIFNLFGQHLKTSTLKGTNDTIDISDLIPGTYLLRISDASGKNPQVLLRFNRQ